MDAIVLAAIRANPEKYYALMKQAEQREREAAQRRRARLHDDYCTQEAARLYRLRRR